jgi:hypothetical protein
VHRQIPLIKVCKINQHRLASTCRVTHVLHDADGYSNRNVGAHGALHNGLSSFEPARLSGRGRRRSVERRREGAADAEEREEQGKELEEAEHGERVWWGIDYRRGRESCEYFSNRWKGAGDWGYIPRRTLSPDLGRLPFSLPRRLLPWLSTIKTINKSLDLDSKAI